MNASIEVRIARVRLFRPSESEISIWGLQTKATWSESFLQAGNKRPPCITISWLIGGASKSGCHSRGPESRVVARIDFALSVYSLRLELINIYGAHNAACWARPIISPLTALRYLGARILGNVCGCVLQMQRSEHFPLKDLCSLTCNLKARTTDSSRRRKAKLSLCGILFLCSRNNNWGKDAELKD